MIKSQFLIVALGLTCTAWASEPEKVQIPNDLHYWEKEAFVEMVGPLRLPFDKEHLENIRVMLKIPDDQKVGVSWVESQQRYSLVYPGGTIRPGDSSKEDLHSEETVDDVRGARIDEQLNTIFHDYQEVPDTDGKWLEGFEWQREGAQADAQAADALVKLFFPPGHNWNPNEIKHFRTLNKCAACHEPDAPSPLTTAPPWRWETDTRGFFQPITVLGNSETVRDHRDWDFNADDPFITVWCGDQQTHAFVNGDVRNYRCPNDIAPVGKLDIRAALQIHDEHAEQVCQSRLYLYLHMNEDAKKAYRSAFDECGIAL